MPEIKPNKLEPRFILRFMGDKAELKHQLDIYCAVSKKTKNGTIIELIEKLLAEKE